ncbi:MAG: ATP-binding cassette domain-containing protein [Candidatus Aminicenantes bacterium]|nr:ATP-binding cassette domain-containing protein [Candidatus Aminicenantes bacterium]
MEPGKDAIVVEDLTRVFEDVTAVDRISFRVGQGELFGLLGPNGAGKTTTINMLSTLLRPSSGRAWVGGYDIVKHRDEVRKSIGVVFQETALDGKLTGRENLQFHAMMYGLPREERKHRIDEVLALVDLGEKSGILVEKYSGGMKRRLEIARGLIQDPKVLFLDEPTLGLDAQTRRHIWDYVEKLNRERRVTIILTTHYMEEADFLCSRVAIMDKGRFVALDAPARLKDVLGGDVVSLGVKGEEDCLDGTFRSLSWVKKFVRRGRDVNLTLENGERRIAEIVTLAQQCGATVESVRLREPSLEDVFLHFTGHTIREQEASSADRLRLMMPHRGGRRP